MTKTGGIRTVPTVPIASGETLRSTVNWMQISPVGPFAVLIFLPIPTEFTFFALR